MLPFVANRHEAKLDGELSLDLLTSPLHAFAHVSSPTKSPPVLYLCLTCLLHIEGTLPSSLYNAQKAHCGATLNLEHPGLCICLRADCVLELQS